jgi:plastocyanin
MRLKLVLAFAFSLLAFGIASCGGGDDTSSTETVTESSSSETTTGGGSSTSGGLERSVKVEIVDFAYDPEPVQVATGGKVIWQNQDSAPHTATADDGSFDTGTLEEGKLKSETFKKAGTYTYFCEIHPTMHGTLEVIDQE